MNLLAYLRSLVSTLFHRNQIDSELDTGIPAMLQADTAGGMREHLAWSGHGFKIREDDATEAHDVLARPVISPANDGDQSLDDDPIPPWRKLT